MSQPIMFMGTWQYDIAIIWLPRQGSDLWLHGQGKGVSSRANIIISVKVFVGNTVSSGHHANAVSSS